MIRDIILLENPILTKVSEPMSLEEIKLETPSLIDDMIDTMYHKNGIGIAAVQIDVLKRIFVVELSELHPKPIVFINPVITQRSKDFYTYKEGCLSIPEVTGSVARHRTIKVEYLDQTVNQQELVADELFATCIQHEMDHLDGILFLERLETKEIQKVKQSLEKHNFEQVPVKLGAKAL